MNHLKPYGSVEEARRSKDVLVNGHEVVTGCPCGKVHTREPGKSARKDTGPSRETRDMVNARDMGCCARCGISVAGIPASVHHRTRRSQLGLNDLQNLITLCGSGTTGCHGWVHGHVRQAEAAGWLVRSTGDPLADPALYATPCGPVLFLLTEDGDRVPRDDEAAWSAALWPRRA